MTDTFPSVLTIHGHDTAAASLSNHHDALQPRRFGAATLADEDDDGQISCVCGFSDDDGNTVACDSCNRWQHTICYYPQYEGRDLPEELQHFCVECRPRQPFDAQGAISRQRQRREQQDSFINGHRRQPVKANKKKVRDGSNANGWPLDKSRHDRNSASPRDQPPPAKRPKTSHRTSESNSNTQNTKGHSRKRTASNINHSRSHSDSPERVELYSPEFLRCYQQDDWAVTQANLHTDISITNALTEWLRIHDDEFRDIHGSDKRELLMRWDGHLDDIPGRAQIDIQDVSHERDGSHEASWKIVTVKESVAQGAYIGELKGHVGFIQQYKMDPANRWAQLRHPEPFVFFHLPLKLYIDARNEGTELRYVRRSCHPNAKLQVLVTDQTDYRFCFMALEQIDPGMEIAVAWDTTDSVPNATNGISPTEMNVLSAWVSNVLANCGPCACNTVDCFMSRFDRRRSFKGDSEDGLVSSKGTKPKKRKQTIGRYTSPLTPQLAISRSGSEHRKGDVDDEHADTRSTSGSGRGSLSRDITPSSHYLMNGGTEISERERKKLAKEEEMFKRQAEEQNNRQGKKKRNSAGSNPTTPHVPASKHTLATSARYMDVGAGNTSVGTNRAPKKTKTTASAKPSPRTAMRPTRPVSLNYKSTAVQVDMDAVNTRHPASRLHPQQRFISKKQYLLRYLAEKEMRIKASHSTSAAAAVIAISDPDPVVAASVLAAAASDIVMADVVDEHSTEGTIEMNAIPTSESAMQATSNHDETVPGIEQLSPKELVEMSDVVQARAALQLVMQPPATSTSVGPDDTLQPILTTGIANAAQSPLSLTNSAGPIFSPSVTAVVTPSPARKKLSLSDYTRRSKAKDKDGDPSLQRESSPASTASGPIGLPGPDSKSNEVASAVSEETKMDDVINNEMLLSKSSKPFPVDKASPERERPKGV